MNLPMLGRNGSVQKENKHEVQLSHTFSLSPRMFLEILLLMFILLKLTGQIDWSWWWVLSPFLVPLVIGLSLVGFLWLVKYIATREPKPRKTKED